MDFVVIIPARYASQRLPGKPLLDIEGKPMVQRVYERATESRATEVIVATDDARVYDAVCSFGGNACMTSSTHTSGTDRLQEVAAIKGYGGDQIVVNVQGDEPLMPAEAIDQVAANLQRHVAQIATLSEAITEYDDFADPNVVKVVVGEDGYALYFSRAPIPWPRDAAAHRLPANCQKHLGIYAYRVAFLDDFVTWAPTEIEQTEKLEQLRALWHGVRIHTDESCAPIPPGVDTQSDLLRVIEAVRKSQH